MMTLRKILFHKLINIPGWRTNRKILVIESDDWGSIRMPSKETYDNFIKKGVHVDRDPYWRYDSLATEKDLEALFEVLTSVNDKNGNSAVVTADTIVANPDFDKIRAANFNEYFFEPFTVTLKRNPLTEDVFPLWRQGIDDGIFHPQFHGREHLYYRGWMSALKNGDKLTRLAFDSSTFGLTPAVDKSIEDDFLGAFNTGLHEDNLYYKPIVREGLDLFEKIFGFRSESFIATTYTWPPLIEPLLKEEGIKFLQGIPSQRIPLDDSKTFKYKKGIYLGKKSRSGLTYLLRNCHFEPSQYPKLDWVSDCLKRIDIAFRWKKPATISMHRLNVIGAIYESNRTDNLKLLKTILQEVKKGYPDVEFMSSDKLGSLITGK